MQQCTYNQACNKEKIRVSPAVARYPYRRVEEDDTIRSQPGAASAQAFIVSTACCIALHKHVPPGTMAAQQSRVKDTSISALARRSTRHSRKARVRASGDI
ncbi:hypothetical protein ABZX51_005744 [Aspergillus tubingensis]